MIHLLKAEYKKSFIELKTYYPDQIVDITKTSHTNTVC